MLATPFRTACAGERSNINRSLLERMPVQKTLHVSQSSFFFPPRRKYTRSPGLFPALSAAILLGNGFIRVPMSPFFTASTPEDGGSGFGARPLYVVVPRSLIPGPS